MKRNRIFGTLLAGILVTAGLWLAPASASAATATEQQSCVGVDTMVGTSDCSDVLQDVSYSAAKASTSAQVTSVNGVDVHSTVKVVSYIQAKGATKAQKAGHKIRIHKRMRLWTSYFNTSGREVWHWKTYPKGKRFIKGKDGWYHDPVCWNKVKIKTKKHVGKKIYGKIKVVQSFSFHATSVSAVSDYVKVKAQAWANTSNCHAEAMGTGEASFSASATASLTGSVLTRVVAQVKAQSASNLSAKLAGKTLVDIHAQVKTSAAGTATAQAAAQAVCSTTTPPTSPPVVIDVTQVNDVDVTNTTEVCATVSLPGSDSGTLSFAARYGAFTTTKVFTVSGQVTKCATYMAPTEVPSGGTDTITYTIRDNVTGQSASDTTTFTVNPSPPPPL